MTPARHQALTVVAPLEPGAERALEGWLRESARALRRALTPSTTTHFARWVILPSPGAEGERTGAPPLLVFESNFDGELDAHVTELRERLGPLLDGSFRGVEGFPGSGDVALLVAFFRASSRRSAALVTGHAGLPVSVVRGDAELRAALQARLDELSRASPVVAGTELGLARELQRAARSFAAERGLELDGLAGPEAPPRSAAGPSRPLAVLLVVALSWFFELRDRFEAARPPSFDTPAARARRDALGEEEDRVPQNGLTHLAAVKPGWYRSFSLKVMLPFVAALGLPATHFARWVPLRDGRLLFLGSYDGSWEAYVSALIARAARRLTMVWTHTAGFPPARLSSFGGVKHAAAFKAWLRAHQVPTQVWYSAYPHLSVVEVLRNARIRGLLARELSESSATELLALL